jgi:hypothetical protein
VGREGGGGALCERGKNAFKAFACKERFTRYWQTKIFLFFFFRSSFKPFCRHKKKYSSDRSKFTDLSKTLCVMQKKRANGNL